MTIQGEDPRLDSTGDNLGYSGTWEDITPSTQKTAWSCAAPKPPGFPPGLPANCRTLPDQPAAEGMLADVAQYFYAQRLRDDLPRGRVPVRGTDPEDDLNPDLHMNTYTLGLGVTGHLRYDPAYATQKTPGSGDFYAIRSGDKSWIPTGDAIAPGYNGVPLGARTRIDDLWHAAVNGRGQYFSANNPEDVVAQLAKIIDALVPETGAGAPAAITNLELRTTGEAVYAARYDTVRWAGDVLRYELESSGGTLAIKPNPVSAAAKLATRVGADCDDRRIFLMKGREVAEFTWKTRACSGGNAVATDLDDDDRDGLDPGRVWSGFRDNGNGRDPSDLVNFLRGQWGAESDAANAERRRFRTRKDDRQRRTVLGDIVGSSPVVVQAPRFNYADPGYVGAAGGRPGYKSDPIGNGTTRPAMLYVGGNDGMLHAFDATTMDERWAMIPGSLMGELPQLAVPGYGGRHRFFVDGTPVVGDVFDGTRWRTILVGGMNAGGQSYFALDVTDPSPERMAQAGALWEFRGARRCPSRPANIVCDENLGQTWGNPIITKVPADPARYPYGRWVVIVASGYNTADGHGYLYVLDAISGEILRRFEVTDPVRPVNPNREIGLAKIEGFVDDVMTNNLVKYVYGGDLLGNVWRFDFTTGPDPSGWRASRLATLEAGGVAQPITTRPELGEIGGRPVVLVGTGRLLDDGDAGDAAQQSLYGIIDRGLNDLTRSSLAERVLRGASRDAIASAPIAANGWYIDLPLAGERIVADPQLQLGTVAFASSAPTTGACSVASTGFLTFVDFRSGTAVVGSPNGQVRLPLAENPVGLTLAADPTGQLVGVTIGDKGTLAATPVVANVGKVTGRRVSWREIVTP